ncbi:Asp-tRNA(Asn)/Glu-tRNA(Gln) amidotransferase subunit GatC [Eubacteriales bacterium OttesenSCG-928-M02]|nr:Asp-tRNA(Asn)/Glu-tRNA(Gln) amidotransferase subunit GatC [Eubacteriales bacterium OttesenSCG-928-M02]MDL2225859.1 Asp-tRNA(Asn)/Glu-tRNA(Gln) amidotransferase subunit GatC [Eubacteriales bacterium OttesenSCG-928-M02]
MNIDDKLIDYVAELSRLKLAGEERERAKRDLASALGHMEILDEVNVSGVEAITHPQPITNALRRDVVVASYDRETLLKNAPQQADGCFVVPKTVE